MKLAAVVVSALVVFAAQAAAKEPAAPKIVFGIVWNLRDTSFVKLDALTLKRVSKTVPIGVAASYLGRSPGRGSRAAFAVGESGTAMVFVDLQAMKRERRIALPCGIRSPIVWESARRLVATCGGAASSVVVVDPVARKVRSRTPLSGELVDVERAGDVLVGLVAPLGAIGPSRLVVVNGVGMVRTVSLPDVRAGTQVLDQSTAHTRVEMPALAVDPTSRLAAVVPAQGPISVVDVGTLAVSRHVIAERTLAAARKNAEGYGRKAAWIRANTIAVTGRDWTSTTPDTATPAGLTTIDLASGTAATIDHESAELASVTAGPLLAWGTRWDGAAGRSVGNGLVGYDPSGALRFHLFAGEPVNVVAVVGSYAYLASSDFMHYRVIDTRDGRVVATPSVTRSATIVRP